MAGRLRGYIDMDLDKDADGYRNYTLRTLVETTDYDDGPRTVLFTPGLPAIGSSWNFGNDLDIWARCRPNARVKPVRSGEKNRFWTVEQVFSNRPLRRCQTTSIENPLSEPANISGTFVKFSEEKAIDRFGNFIKSSSHERLRGPQVEFDSNRPTVTIEQNVLNLGLGDFSSMIDTVNDRTMWGLPPRTIKLSNVSFDRKVYGSCSFYFTRRLDFDINYNTFDKDATDEGYMVLWGWWEKDTGYTPPLYTWVTHPDANENNPHHFMRWKDANEENGAKVLLDGHGRPLDLTGTAAPVPIHVEYYSESNFYLLGVPAYIG